jgi:hypothetical protein
LTGDALVLGGHTTIGVNHDISFLSVLKLTTVSFCAIFYRVFATWARTFGITFANFVLGLIAFENI